jgi:predicted enzyme related to lactoylglutathione lyase
VNALLKLQAKGLLGAGVFETNDCRKTYEELKAKGVQFTSPPSDKFYGVEAIMQDNSGNWFSMTERPSEPNANASKER